MNKSRLSLPLGMLVLLLVASLLTGCFREAAPDVTDVPADAQQAGDQPADDQMPDLEASAIAQSTQDAETVAEGTSPADEETQPTEEPTSPPPTNTPVPPTNTPSTTAAATFTPVPTTPTPTPVPVTGEVKHTVQAGENLFRIALKYGTTVDAIASANGIANPAMIYVGQELTISSSSGGSQPPASGGTTHVVQPGDNLFRIALRYNMSYVTLAQHNGIANPSNIYVGQVIRIP